MTEPTNLTAVPSAPAPPGRARKFWGWLLDYAYLTYWTVRAFFGRGRSDQFLHPATGPKAPILLIPGVYESWRFMQPVAEHLFRAGHPVHVVDKLGYNTGAIPTMAEVVREYLEQLDLTEVIVVAHSKGGLIAKSALVEAETFRRVRRVIALNTPFAGSRYANMFLIRSVRMFVPNGQVIRALQANLVVNRIISSLYSVFDPHIPETSHLEGAENIVLPAIGHFRPISVPETLRTVDAIIARSITDRSY